MVGSEVDLLQVAQLVSVLMVAGLIAGFVAGLFGIGGGFVVVPALLLVFTVFGVDGESMTHIAIGTSLATIVVTSLRSVHAHNKKGAVDFQIIRDWAPYLVLGVGIGLILALFMDGRSLKWIFAIGVFFMGLHFIAPFYQPKEPVTSEMPKGMPLASIATFLGAFSALLGIGGGTIAVLVMTSCGRQIHQAVATAAGFGVLIALPGAIGFVLLGLFTPHGQLPFGSFGYINMIAVLAITAMSFITAPMGAKAAHSLNGVVLKKVFGVYLVATSGLVLYNSLTT
ncbi:MAG: sulfite exporter TauE/SafE family protein [Pseudomonadota bacterium]